MKQHSVIHLMPWLPFLIAVRFISTHPSNAPVNVTSDPAILQQISSSTIIRSEDYFPLQVGNKWWSIGIKGSAYVLDSISVTSTTIIRDTTYFVMNNSELSRKDTAGSIFKRIDDIDQLFYKMNAKIGERWTIKTNTRTYQMFLVRDSVQISTGLGPFLGCKIFQFQPVGPDSDKSVTLVLAPGFGEVAHYTETGVEPMVRWELRRAIVNGALFSGPFQMQAQTPARNQIEVKVNSNLHFRFKSWVDTSLVLNKVRVFSRKQGELQGRLHSGGPPFWFFTFYPPAWFASFDTITVRISADIHDVFSEGLDGSGNWKYEGTPIDDYSWTFFTDKGFDLPLAPEMWSEPIQPSTISTLEHIEAQPSINRSGNRLFLFKTDGIAFSIFQNNGNWSSPMMLSHRINSGIEEAPSISPDQKKLYFRRYGGGYGGWDLWVSEWSDSLNDWSEARNLGSNINIDSDEWFCFTPDNEYLYFGRFEGSFWVSQWDSTLKQWGESQSFDNYRLTRGVFVDGLTMPASRKKVYFGRWVDTGKHIEFELLVSYFDSTRGIYNDPMKLNINRHPPDSQPWNNPGNLGYDGYPSVTADGKYLYFESDRGPDWNGNNYHDIYISRLLVDEKGDSVTSVSDRFAPLPQSFNLLQNFPNPFNPETTIKFTLEHRAYVKIQIYDILGKEVRKLIDGFYSAGQHRLTWNARDDQGQPVATGAYSCQLLVDGHVQLKKMMLLR